MLRIVSRKTFHGTGMRMRFDQASGIRTSQAFGIVIIDALIFLEISPKVLVILKIFRFPPPFWFRSFFLFLFAGPKPSNQATNTHCRINILKATWTFEKHEVRRF